MPDEILLEIRRIRDAYSLRFSGDVAAMFADLEASRIAAGRHVVRLPPKSPMPRVLRKEISPENISSTDVARQRGSTARS